ncbi:hypothetical protein CTI12_AA051940 [Artemisia annua]|uniref:Uncharacterized protein n=1 Tax=Artemisia annua TaxID=35608 RepID=A0A2U1QAC7_ARTAN|nr:hypothetical protein CTI12_AA051940 [Artemisia annua]
MTRSNQRNIEQRAAYTPFNLQSGYGSKQDEGFGGIFTKTTHDYIQPDAGQDANHHTFSQDESQASDDFTDFLRDIHGNGPNDNLIAENIAQDRSCGKSDEYPLYNCNTRHEFANVVLASFSCFALCHLPRELEILVDEMLLHTTDRDQQRLLKGNTLHVSDHP